MYSLYKREKKIQIFLYAFVLMLLGLSIAAWASIFTSGDDIPMGIVGGLFFLGLALLFFKFASTMSRPYAKIDALRESSPELVKDMEQDFASAENLKGQIWLGSKYIFWRAFKFHVSTYNQVQSLRVYKHHSNKASYYEIEADINGEKIVTSYSRYDITKEDAIAIAQRISVATGAPLTIDF